MNQRKIKAVNTTRFQASFMLVGLVWLACATLTQAAGKAAHPANATGTAAAVSGSTDLLLYNPINGSATYGTLYADGHFLTAAYHPPYSWTRGWSHIVKTNGVLFFYRESDGLWATSRADQNGYATTLRSGYTGIAKIGQGLVDVVSTPNGILICRGGPRRDTQYAGGGIVGQVGNDGSFRVTYAGNFAAWAKVVYTPNGLVFYKSNYLGTGYVAVGRIQPNGAFVQTYSSTLAGQWLENEVIAVGNDLVFLAYAHYVHVFPETTFNHVTGRYRVGGITSSGQFALRSELCSPALAGGFLVPTVIGNDLFLYAAEDTVFSPDDPSLFTDSFTRLVQSGWGMVASFGGSGIFYPNPSCRGKLIIKQEHSEGSFGNGYKIISTANGIFFYHPTFGSVRVGSFDVDGNFIETQNIPNWLDPGYRMVVNVTD